MKPEFLTDTKKEKASPASPAAPVTAEEVRTLTVDEASAGLRLDAFVALAAGLSVPCLVTSRNGRAMA